MVIEITELMAKRSLFILLALTVCISTSNGVNAAGQWQANDNGTVTDLATGLVWQQRNDDITRRQTDAVIYCSGLNLGGASNWRLPEVKELFSITDERVDTPSIDDAAFPNTSSSRYWSASGPAFSAGGAWVVNFFNGTVLSSEATNDHYVRCVRQG